jgi:hypothetical protein
LQIILCVHPLLRTQSTGRITLCTGRTLRPVHRVRMGHNPLAQGRK